MRVGDNLEVIGSVFDLTGTGDAMAFRTSTPIRVIRWGIITSTAIVGTDATLALDHTTHEADASVTREDAAGTNYLTVEAEAGIGAVFYAEPAANDEVTCKPGDILHIDGLTVIGTSGSGYPFIQYQKLNWDKTGANANYSDSTPTTRMYDGNTA